MKPAFRPFLALALPLCLPLTAARAQGGVTTWAQSLGVGSYDQNGQPRTDGGGSGSDLPVGIAPMPDGGVVVAGQLSLPELDDAAGRGRRTGALVRYDARGAILWQQLLRQNNDAGPDIATNRVDRLRTDAAGNIFVGGFKHNSREQNVTAFVAKFGPDGALLWQNGFLHFASNGFPDAGMVGGDGSGTGLSLDLLPDGGVIIGTDINYLGVNNGNYAAPFIARFNADGSPGFQREFETSYQSSISVITLCRRPDADGYALILNHVEDGNSVAEIILTDAVGNPVFQRILSASGYGGGFPSFITTSADGDFLLLSSLAANNGGGVEVRKLRPDLTPIWQKLVRQFGSGGHTLTPTPDGGCILNGQASALVPDQSHYTPVALLLTLDGNGTLTAAHELGGNGGEGETDTASIIGAPPVTCQTTDGALAFTISTFSYATSPGALADWWVVKANAAGKVPGFADIMLDVPLATFGELDSDEKASFPPASPYGAGIVRSVATTSQPGLVPENLANNTGINKPTVKFQAAPVTGSGHLPFFNGEAALGNGVYYLQFPGGSPFGYYSFLADPHYIYHQDLGYEYVFEAGDGKNGVFLYDFKSGGFFYTSPSFPFPYLYDFSLNTVLYYFPDPNNPGRYNTDGVRYFSNLTTGEIISK